jgi:putative membrane protein
MEFNLLNPVFQKNDKKAKTLIWIFSAVIFLAVATMGAIHLKVDLGFNVHIFATINAFINTIVTLLLAAALAAVKLKKFILHKRLMLTAMVLSVLFLISYVCHHLFAGDTSYGGEGGLRYLYFFILITHIFLAAIIMPFVLFTAYRALIAEFPQHKKLARITWPIWFYVSVTGVLVYLFISPYYH